MTLWSRAVLGALVGAVITLLIHPSSRPFLAGPFIESSTLIEERQYLPTSFPETLPEPNDEISASLWIHVGAEQLRKGYTLSPQQLEGLLKISRKRAEREPNNAFWKMAEAIFLKRLDRRDESLAAWLAASRCITYDDFQSRYLAQIRQTLANATASNSWQYAYCYRLRSFAFAWLAETFARSLVVRLSRTKPEDLNLRYATLVNGSLLRDGSRNLEIMRHGIGIVELASYPEKLLVERSIKRLLIAHFEFKEALRVAGMQDKADKVDAFYNENEGWRALTRREDTDEKVSNLTLFSALWPNLPGVLLQTALLCCVIWLAGILLEWLAKNRPKIAIIVAATFAFLLSAGVLVLTRSWLAFTAASLSCLFVFLSPKTVRTFLPHDLGPLFIFCTSVLATALIGLTGIMFLSRTLPVQASVATFPPQFATLVDFQIAAGLAAIIVSVLYLLAPLWSLALHIRTLFVLGRGFRCLGAIAGVTSLLLSIAATPFCVYFESQNSDTFRMLMENESYYYVRQ